MADGCAGKALSRCRPPCDIASSRGTARAHSEAKAAAAMAGMNAISSKQLIPLDTWTAVWSTYTSAAAMASTT